MWFGLEIDVVGLPPLHQALISISAIQNMFIKLNTCLLNTGISQKRMDVMKIVKRTSGHNIAQHI